MSFDRDTQIRQLLHGQALPATQPVPPPLYGYDPKYVPRYGYDPAAARALLDKFGYKDRDGDGYRELPDGKALTIVLASTTDAAARARDELWKRCLDAIGVRVTFLKNKWTELNKMSEAGQLMMWGLAWISNIPDGRDYYGYFYSPNIGMSNDARMRLPAFDALFQQSLALPEGRERTALFDRMNDLIFDYAPWILTELSLRQRRRAALAQGVQAERVSAPPVDVLRRSDALTAVRSRISASGGRPASVRRSRTRSAQRNPRATRRAGSRCRARTCCPTTAA